MLAKEGCKRGPVLPLLKSLRQQNLRQAKKICNKCMQKQKFKIKFKFFQGGNSMQLGGAIVDF